MTDSSMTWTLRSNDLFSALTVSFLALREIGNKDYVASVHNIDPSAFTALNPTWHVSAKLGRPFQYVPAIAIQAESDFTELGPIQLSSLFPEIVLEISSWSRNSVPAKEAFRLARAQFTDASNQRWTEYLDSRE